MSLKTVKKLYYSIGDVSEITALKQYVLRYWETEFSILKPNKNSAGNRIYKDQDIKIIKHIQSLLYEKKYTIKGAKLFLKNYYSNGSSKSKIINISDKTKINDKFLLKLKSELVELISLIDNTK